MQHITRWFNVHCCVRLELWNFVFVRAEKIQRNRRKNYCARTKINRAQAACDASSVHLTQAPAEGREILSLLLHPSPSQCVKCLVYHYLISSTGEGNLCFWVRIVSIDLKSSGSRIASITCARDGNVIWTLCRCTSSPHASNHGNRMTSDVVRVPAQCIEFRRSLALGRY